jgi:DTW domain-containing protein YfiP
MPHCWCDLLKPMNVETKFVFLMHPHELKKVRAGTGRFASLCLAQSEIHAGITFDHDPAVRSLIDDPQNFAVLLYPGHAARDIDANPLTQADLGGRRLTVFFLDATWRIAWKMLHLSPMLQALPQIAFTPREKSRFVIKRQPHVHCLSTLEAAHELMLALERAGLDRYERPGQMLAAFKAMQDFQIKCAAANRAPRTRKHH